MRQKDRFDFAELTPRQMRGNPLHGIDPQKMGPLDLVPFRELSSGEKELGAKNWPENSCKVRGTGDTGCRLPDAPGSPHPAAVPAGWGDRSDLASAGLSSGQAPSLTPGSSPGQALPRGATIASRSRGWRRRGLCRDNPTRHARELGPFASLRLRV